MAEPTQPISPDAEVPTPFRPETVPGSGPGCSRVGLIGCGVLILLLGVAAIVFFLKATDLFLWAMTRFEVEITEALPEDYSDEERERLAKAFAAARSAVREGEADPAALQRLQVELRDSLLDEDGTLSRQEVLELVVALEEVAGMAAPDAPPGPQARSSRLAVSTAG